MRISELLLETYLNQLDEMVTRPGTMYGAALILFDAGYFQLGRGSFGTVYSKLGANHVLKLFKSTDRAYRTFVQLVINNPNSHFPKFKGKMMKITDDYYAIRMEKLRENSDQSLADILENYILFKQGENTRGATIAMRDLNKTQRGIKKACDIIAKGISTHGVDLHYGNIMWRGNTIVIVDPMAY